MEEESGATLRRWSGVVEGADAAGSLESGLVLSDDGIGTTFAPPPFSDVASICPWIDLGLILSEVLLCGGFELPFDDGATSIAVLVHGVLLFMAWTAERLTLAWL